VRGNGSDITKSDVDVWHVSCGYLKSWVGMTGNKRIHGSITVDKEGCIDEMKIPFFLHDVK